jgi:flagellar protein FlaG
MAGTFTSAGHASDQQLRTDFKIVLAVANDTPCAKIWMKNTGSVQIPISDIMHSDVICGGPGHFDRLSLTGGQWTYTVSGQNPTSYWGPGETLEIDACTGTLDTTGNLNYFQFTLPNGIWRSDQFTANPP